MKGTRIACVRLRLLEVRLEDQASKFSSICLTISGLPAVDDQAYEVTVAARALFDHILRCDLYAHIRNVGFLGQQQDQCGVSESHSALVKIALGAGFSLVLQPAG